MEDFNLIDRVDGATRKDSILDHIWLNDDLRDIYPNFADVGPPLSSSDHNCVFLKPVCEAHNPKSCRSVVVWDFRDSYVSDFLQKLSITDFNFIEQEYSLDDMCAKFYELLWNCLTTIPCDTVKFSSRDKQWMTPILKCLINKRWRAFREKNWTLYKHYKEKVRLEILKAKRIWCQKHSKSARGLWNVVRSFRGSNVKDPWRNLIGDLGGPRELLVQLTSQFCSSFNEDVAQLLPLSDQKWSFKITAEAVYEQLSKLQCGKATGPDLVPTRLLKIGASFLCHPLAAIFNASIVHKEFPACFKVAHVCPIPKTSDPQISDFRPISLLSPLSKIFERLVLVNIKRELVAVYGPDQHAYRPLGSTTTALVDICDQVTAALDMKNVSHINMFCLDLSKAFDKLSHNRLINYLSAQGINHGFLRWLCSYLSARTMCVRLHDSFGPTVTVPSGVPQGSVLGPFLFAAYMGAIKFDDLRVNCTKYADDVTLIEPVLGENASSVSLDECISIFNQWGLFVNRKKCQQLHICRKPLCSADVSDSGFTNVVSVKVLGFHFTRRFTWEEHISNLLKIVSRRLFIIRCMKSCITREELVKIYHALITSVICYASPAIGSPPLTLMTKLERFQRRAHRLICDQPACECDSFPPLRLRFEDAAIKLLLQAEHNVGHPLHDRLPRRLPVTNHFTNPVCITNRRLNSFFPWACRLINTRTDI